MTAGMPPGPVAGQRIVNPLGVAVPEFGRWLDWLKRFSSDANASLTAEQAAWSPIVATLTVDVGTISQVSASAFLQVGKRVYYQINETLTVTSGAPTVVHIAIPIATKRDLTMIGKVASVAGNQLSARFVASGTVSGTFRKYDGTVFAPVTNDIYDFSGVYEGI